MWFLGQVLGLGEHLVLAYECTIDGSKGRRPQHHGCKRPRENNTNNLHYVPFWYDNGLPIPRLLASPKQNNTPSRMLLLPDPLGPVTTVKPSSRGIDMAPPKDLKCFNPT